MEVGNDQREVKGHVRRKSHTRPRSRRLMKEPPPVGWTYRPVAPKTHLHEANSSRVGDADDEDEEQINGFHNLWRSMSRERQRALAGQLCRPSCPLDTFPSIDRAARPWVYGVLDHYTNFWGGAAFKAEFQIPGSQRSRHQEAINELTRGAIHQPQHLYSLASAVSARLHYVRLEPNALSRYGQSPRPEWFLDKGIQGLQRYFANLKDGEPVDPATIYDVHCLYSAEFFAKNYDAARTHLQIFDFLVKRASASDPLTFYCRELWALGDMWMAPETLSPPVYVSPCTPLHPLRVREICSGLSPADRAIGSGFLANILLFSSPMATVLTDLISWAQVAQHIWSSATSPPHEARWLSKRASNLLGRLLQIPPPGQRLSLLSKPDPNSLPHQTLHHTTLLLHREESLRITLVIYLSFILTYMAAERSGKLNLPRLKTALLASDLHYSSAWLPNQELLSWILFIGVFVAEQTGVEKVWFVERFVALSGEVGVESGSQLREVLGRYLYSEEMHGGTFGRVSGMLDGEFMTRTVTEGSGEGNLGSESDETESEPGG